MVMGNRGNVPIRLSNVAMEHDPFMDVPMKIMNTFIKGGKFSLPPLIAGRYFFYQIPVCGDNHNVSSGLPTV